MDVESIKKLRIPTRSNFTKALNKADEALDNKEDNTDVLASLIVLIEQKHKDLKDLDKNILAILQDDKTCSQQDFNVEYEAITAYEDRFIETKTKLQRRLNALEKPKAELTVMKESSENIIRKFKLPELELKQFDGEIREWLKFWGQFRKIHEDLDITDDDKFQYLVQSTVKGSPARQLVESFPPSGINYEEAVRCLKQRFGRDDLLIEVYIREMLSVVINNANPQGQKYSLSKLYDNLEGQLRSLKSLGVAKDNFSAILLYPLVESCLPNDLLKVYERTRCELVTTESTGNERLTHLLSFLKKEIESEQKLSIARSSFGLDSNNKKALTHHSQVKRPSAADLFNSAQRSLPVDSKTRECVFCDTFPTHFSKDCQLAKSLTYEKKKDILSQRGICFRCLNSKSKHIARNCKTRVNCTRCNGQHLFVMCKMNDEYHGNKNNEKKAEEKVVTESSLTNKTCMRQVYLQTLVVQIRGNSGTRYIRALIDTGSQRSYISKYAATSMKYEVINEESILHSLFGGVEKAESHKKYLIHLSNVNNSYHCNFEVLDQEMICSNISRVTLSPYVKELKTHKIFLTDVVHAYDDQLLYQYSPSEVHVLIGADVAGKLLSGGIEELNSGLVCVQYKLGWAVMGKTNETEKHDSTKTVLSCHVNDANISDLWRLDTLGISDPSEKKTREELEQSAKEHFFRTITRNSEGRYQVSLPWVEGHPPLTNCKELSEKRIVNCIKSLKKLGKIEEYETIFKDWLDQGIIEEVDSSEPEHYLPHRPVFKENSTTKVRPVFDGSARDKNSPSINDCLEKGPNLVELIPSVLNRFRIGKYGVIADIEKAFLQIELHEHDRPYLKFLWWQDGQKEQLRIFQHRRVVFGITSSPFLLEATLEFHLNNAPPEYKETAQKLLKSFYVDNCVHSVDNEKELVRFIHESQEILAPAKFNLRGWESTPFKENEINLAETKTVSVLGLKWESKNDTLSVDLRDLDPIPENQPVTKRIILSTVHKIFDPIGFSCPATVMPKLMLQECWKLKLSWDTELPSWMAKKFVKWKNEIKILNEIFIPRCLDRNEGDRKITLHVFCDASEKAYATCVFLRSEGFDSTDCQLVQARARVAPLKSTSVSRLELLACNIGARLCQSVKDSLGMEEVVTRYWSDSSNALYWIKKNENWATFVFNRVKEIRLLSDPDDWNHISGQLNPADLPSRGCSFETLAKSNWWLGPPWLKNPPENWPKSNIFPDEEIVNAEKRKTVVSVTNTETEVKIYDIFSSYPRLLMVVSWIYRFLDNCRVKKNFRKSGSLTVEERNRTEISLIKLAQRESFTGPQDKRLQKLQIFEDENGLFRIKTRLSLKDDLKNFKFPIVLPCEHSIVEKLVRWKHCSLGHAGVQTVMTNLREEFWILKYRKTVRKVINNCVTCKRFDSRPIETPTAPLPVDRLRAASVFEITGVDFAGPLYLKGNQKSWIVIYTCAVFRAIHLELTTSLSTESFLQSFRRYVARRGRPSVVYSDNGTNFVGASNLIKKIDWEAVSKYSTVNKINWKFIPPSSPWWGGFWERLIGIVKRILRKVLGQTSLNFEELNTVLCDCESIINSRPLTYLSDDASDLEPLTPNMFLQEVKEIGIPDLDHLDSKSLNKRFAYRQRLRRDLRKRFRSEYLGQLRQFERKMRSSPSIKIGDVVLISSDNMKRMDWPLGKVIEVFTSPDGNIRLVKLKTKNGEILRPTLRLYPLEVGDREKEMFQRSEPPVKDRTCGRSSSAEGDSLNKSEPDEPPVIERTCGRSNSAEGDSLNKHEPDEPTSRYGRRLKKVKRLIL